MKTATVKMFKERPNGDLSEFISGLGRIFDIRLLLSIDFFD